MFPGFLRSLRRRGSGQDCRRRPDHRERGVPDEEDDADEDRRALRESSSPSFLFCELREKFPGRRSRAQGLRSRSEGITVISVRLFGLSFLFFFFPSLFVSSFELLPEGLFFHLVPETYSVSQCGSTTRELFTVRSLGL